MTTPSPYRAAEYIPPPAVPAGGSRLLGSEVELTDADGSSLFTASVTESVLNADDLVLAVDGNSPAPAGLQWALVTIDLTVLAVSTLPPDGITVFYISGGNEVYPASDPAAIAPGIDLTTTQYGLGLGESGTAQVAIAIPADSSGDGYWSLQYGQGTTGGTLFYFETE